ncbi:hypothetical protein EIP91_000076 [Steccherinum ochraceum]|uniref:Uncharacterized protein n=1 Tax=Steccherinum ochraceum TaxID=92696 RepID=A0A4R0S4G0_9APHY|nr:hypothetical protein EIP91_000076 [Steccherinum ochraceum]
MDASSDYSERVQAAAIPQSVSDIQIVLLKDILRTLQQSTIAKHAVDPDPRAQFWQRYMDVAKEYDDDRLRKYDVETDITLIFLPRTRHVELGSLIPSTIGQTQDIMEDMHLSLGSLPRNRSEELDALCVEWLLVTSTEPDVILVAARMALEVQWHQVRVKIDLVSMLSQLIEHLALPPTRTGNVDLAETVTVCGRAMLTMIMEYGVADADMLGSSRRVDLAFLRGFRSDDRDLMFICEALRGLLPGTRPVPFEDPDSEHRYLAIQGSEPVPLPSISLVNWFSRRVVRHLSIKSISRSQKVFYAIVLSRWLKIPVGPEMSSEAQADCVLAAGMLLGYSPPRKLLQMSDKSPVLHHSVANAIKQLRAVLRPLSTESIQDDLSQSTEARCGLLLLDPMMHIVIEAVARGDSLHVFHDVGTHRLCLYLCRESLRDEALDFRVSRALPIRSSFSDTQSRLRLSVPSLLQLSIDVARPTLMVTMPEPGTLRSVKNAMACVWQVRFEVTLSDHMAPADAHWIISLITEAYTEITQQPWETSEESIHLLANCMTILCHIPGTQTITHSESALFSIVRWAMIHPAPLLRHASLRLARTLHTPGRMVMPAGIRPLVEKFGGISLFLEALALAGPNLRDEGSQDRAPWCYQWILAYLDLIFAVSYHSDWVDEVAEHHGRACLVFADYLLASISVPQEERWDVVVTPGDPSAILVYDPHNQDLAPLSRFIGWNHEPSESHTGTRPPPRLTAAYGRLKSNPYVRDVWRRLVQIILLCEDGMPEFLTRFTPVHHANLLLLEVHVACVPWHILDTHPLPLDTLKLAASFTRKILERLPTSNTSGDTKRDIAKVLWHTEADLRRLTQGLDKPPDMIARTMLPVFSRALEWASADVVVPPP